MKGQLKSITAEIPDCKDMVDGKSYYVGDMNNKSVWVENHLGEGTEIPIEAFDKALEKLFKKYF